MKRHFLLCLISYWLISSPACTFRLIELFQMDVKTTFLSGDLVKEIYMDQPVGFVSKNQEEKICCPKRSINLSSNLLENGTLDSTKLLLLLAFPWHLNFIVNMLINKRGDCVSYSVC